MKNIIEINDITALELDVYARTSEVQLLRYNEPNPDVYKRQAFGWDVEMTIYLKQDIRRNGLGRHMYTLMEDILREQGLSLIHI